jgi:CRISPR/Cas system-associated endoribonuclease Cas2
MANNLIISYDLNNPGQNYERLIEAIKGLGSWAKIQKSVWYVDSSLTAVQVVTHLWARMDASDSLFVVDATSGQCAWQGLSQVVATHLHEHWGK